MRQRQISDAVWASLLAAKWAQSLELPAGNTWEAAIARYLLKELAIHGDRDSVEMMFALQLGMQR